MFCEMIDDAFPRLNVRNKRRHSDKILQRRILV